MLKIGDKLPSNIVIQDDAGNDVKLANYLDSKYLVLYIYPTDDTPGCTTEACEFRDYNSELEKIGAKVVGISKDSIKSHKKFQTKYKLNFTLLSDIEHNLLEALGVWQEKKFMGKSYMGSVRTTFLANNKGEIIYIWENVKAEGHAKEVFEKVKTL